MRICLVGCCHGELQRIYKSLNTSQVNLVLIAGDFQAARDVTDLNSMAVPNKYKRMGDFEKYYTKKLRAPILTIFIGGNHEASKHMLEHVNGGWVADNMYYLGRAGVIDVGGITIGGLSGIYAPEHYEWPHFEQHPFNSKTLRSVYHIRRPEVSRLLQMPKNEIDIFMSHDWPAGIEHHGDLGYLLSRKKFLKSEIQNKTLGSPPAMEILRTLQPPLWLSAHMHVKYKAKVDHKSGTTKFLALDKVEGRRSFMEIVEVGGEVRGKLKVKENEQWRKIRMEAEAAEASELHGHTDEVNLEKTTQD